MIPGLYILYCGLSFNYLSYITKQTSPIIILFFGSVIAIVFFNTINYNNIVNTYQKCFKDYRSWGLMMLLLLLDWLNMFFALTYGNAFIYLFFSYSALSLFGVFFSNYKRYGLITGVLIMLLASVLIFQSIKINDLLSIFVVICSIASGGCWYFYSAVSEIFAKKNHLYSSQILAVRFWLLLMFSGSGLFIIDSHLISGESLYYGFLTGLLIFIIPIYLFQFGVLSLGANKYSTLQAFTPFIALVISFIANTTIYSCLELYISFALGVVILVATFRRQPH